jgi:hypothetical protein
MKALRQIYIIGAGGVTSYLLPPLLKILSHQYKIPPKITIFDGDNLEERNLERQLFNVVDAMAKRNKAESLVGMYRASYPLNQYGLATLEAVNEYFYDGMELEDGSLVFVCVDNHSARKAALFVCDKYFCNAILAANEFTDAQSIFYNPFNAGTILDPRVRYPEILSDESEDPRRPESCTSEAALQKTPQLPIFNMSAAAYALQLFWFYYYTVLLMDRSSKDYWPVEHSNNINKITTRTEEICLKENGG